MKEDEMVGKSKYDKKFHLLRKHGGVWKRVCTWFPVNPLPPVKGDTITCQNCLIRQYDDDWSQQ